MLITLTSTVRNVDSKKISQTFVFILAIHVKENIMNIYLRVNTQAVRKQLSYSSANDPFEGDLRPRFIKTERSSSSKENNVLFIS